MNRNVSIQNYTIVTNEFIKIMEDSINDGSFRVSNIINRISENTYINKTIVDYVINILTFNNNKFSFVNQDMIIHDFKEI
jgi:hypothetical protein